MTSRLRAILLTAVTALVAGLVLAAPAQAAPGSDLLAPSPPGSNDFSCRPSAQHPNPVVLVHGLLATQFDNWQYVSPQLKARGYCVFSLTYGQNALLPPPVGLVGGLAPMERSAQELATFVQRVRSATGAAKVDIVGHSEGSLMPDYYVKFLGGSRSVDRYVGLTPLWKGTNTLALDFLNRTGEELGLDPVLVASLDQACASCRQFLAGSDFIRRMNSDGGPKVDGVTYTMILTRYDELVVPYTSGLLEGATNIVLQEGCPTDLAEHAAVAYDPVTMQHIANALDPAHARPVQCLPVPPRGLRG
ncbi:lipase [Actinomycetospora sp. CA-084318]|uniref:esterase/lipase family protein n=1 Tax=Actinomycetospora sp. CA-084318 TaxID=3239892 RepID=UPI003D960C9C